jgi:uridine kinase
VPNRVDKSDTASVERRESHVQRLPLDDGVKHLVDRVAELESKSASPIIVEIAGASGSGKTTRVLAKLREKFQDRALLISIDDYYLGASNFKGGKLNFDHPGSVNLDLLREHLRLLKAGKWIEKPIYSFETAETIGKERVDPKRIIIIEGIFTLNEKLTAEGDLKVFVDVSPHGRLIRRLIRDVQRPCFFSNPSKSMQYMTNVVEPMYREHIASTKQNADLIIENIYDPYREAASTGIIEAQRKYKADIDPETLRTVGAHMLSSSNQADYYYVPQEGSFDDTREIVRIRKENKKLVFTYKGPKKPSSNAIERYKFECEIDGKTEQGMLSVYAINPKVITKDRTMYGYKGIVFSVDTDVYKSEKGKRTELGNFIEVNVPQSESEIKSLAELLKGLNIKQSSMILKSYDEM